MTNIFHYKVVYILLFQIVHFTVNSSLVGTCEGSSFWTKSSVSESDNEDKSMISSEPSLLSVKTSFSASGSAIQKNVN